MISKKKLIKWRKYALINSEPISIEFIDNKGLIMLHQEKEELFRRILLMTQELIDQHLMKGK